MPLSTHTRGLVIRDVVVAAAVLVVLGMLAVVLSRRGWVESARGVDLDNLRTLHRGLVLWGQSGPDCYTLPSYYDSPEGTVEASTPGAKNTTANIYSQIIWNGFASPSQFVSPLERNPAIRPMQKYSYTFPPKARDPKTAMWDPAFSVDFTNGRAGNTSYAHQMPGKAEVGDRTTRLINSPRWANTFSALDPILANRGPEIAAVSADGVATLRNPRSLALGWHGPNDQWQGHIVYNDGHTELTRTMRPAAVLYPPKAEKPRPDVIFFDEPDSLPDANAYLGIFPVAGPTSADYREVWD